MTYSDSVQLALNAAVNLKAAIVGAASEGNVTDADADAWTETIEALTASILPADGADVSDAEAEAPELKAKPQGAKAASK